ncbi:hypothetical protein [Parvibaculum sp.]|uniref:hypothetical protein n=1 Tax=Parvibaculum sp. TaxID=2024848 RepID=UPI002CD3CE97|nr:hypothetical protein [Parvibaculum sp.]HUD50368.1 hypothetical protein [Parvibaculum sp.]
MPRHRFAAVVAGCLMLAACFVSKTPLFGPAEADYPVPDGARFTVHKLDDNGERTNDAPRHLTVSRKGADYLYTLDGEEPVAGLMDDVGDGDYIVLGRDMSKPGEVLYSLFRKKGDGWLRYSPNCSDFARAIAAKGMSRETFNIAPSGNDCAFSNYDDLKRAMRELVKVSAPDNEYVKE